VIPQQRASRMTREQFATVWAFSRAPERRWVWYVAAAVVYGVIQAWPLADFTPEGQRALAVAGVAAFLWVTNTVPPAITGVVVLFLLPFSGALSSKLTYAYFGNHAVFLVLGAFILASPVMRSGLSTRIALWAVSTFGRSEGALIVSILWIGALMSLVVSEHAVAAMLFPIVLEIVQAIDDRRDSRFGLAAFLALAWGVVIGGTVTVLGGARAPLALGILEDTTGDTIGFVRWMVWAAPASLTLLVVAHIWLLRMSRDVTVSLEVARDFLQRRSRELGRVSDREKRTAAVMLVTIALWIVRGDAWGLDTIALLGVLLAFALRVADWHEVEEDVNWGVFVMYGSAIALSAALRDTGAAAGLAQRVLDSPANSAPVIFGIIVLMAMGLTEIMSNAASVAVLMPVALVLSQNYGIDPAAATLGVAVPAGLAFMIPVSTPAIAIVLSVPYVSAWQLLVRGFWLKLLGLIVFLATVLLIWPLIGLSPW